MKFMQKRTHMIDFIFPVVLLFVFAVSALVVTLFATNVYQGAVDNSTRNDTARTSLSYITEKIHAGDNDGNVELGMFDGCDAVVISEEINGEEYATYIYVHDGQLKELFAKANAGFSAENGTRILDVNDFSMEQKRDGVFSFSCTDDKGKNATAVVGVRSSK
ncbi:MAG: DUF4860 domain-containing protein [Clostridia bacterium]|nr:DUF4860 domain-containing protein [Clostridia bacterium]